MMLARRTLTAALSAFSLVVVAAASSSPARASISMAKACAAIRNPYPDSKFEGLSLNTITAAGVSCTTARSVARGAHYKALGITPPEDGIRRFPWNGWRVVGDLRPASDRYTATKNGHVVHWRF